MRRQQYEAAERDAGRLPDPVIASRIQAGEDLYPNCHIDIWLRSCREEVEMPLKGQVTGIFPAWLKGTLLRNGPGSLQCGDEYFQHLFDGPALIQRYCISNGTVTYQCRFLRSQTFLKNSIANRIVVTEFGTRAAPDPCQSIFRKISALFSPGEALSDNAIISIYPIGDEYYAFTESPVMTRIDPVNLDTLGRVDVSSYLGIVNHTSHPIVLEDGSVVNLGLGLSAKGPRYSFVHFPPKQPGVTASPARSGRVCGSVPSRWPLHPSYMHSFGCTESFWVLVEQPLTVSVPALVRGQLHGEPVAGSLRWFPEYPTLIHLVCRATGRHVHTFRMKSFFFLHIINCFERGSYTHARTPGAPLEVVIDICSYKDPAMINCMYIDSLQNAQRNPDYARLFRGRPLRFVLPLPPRTDAMSEEVLCELGCETPRINPNVVGKKYRYFYAISADVDAENPGTVIKVDTFHGSYQTWGEPGLYPSEPIFVPRPNGQDEDDGAVLCALIWGDDVRRAGLLVLDAKTWTEMGRAEFWTPGEVPKCLHGWFDPSIS